MFALSLLFGGYGYPASASSVASVLAGHITVIAAGMQPELADAAGAAAHGARRAALRYRHPDKRHITGLDAALLAGDHHVAALVCALGEAVTSPTTGIPATLGDEPGPETGQEA